MTQKKEFHIDLVGFIIILAVLVLTFVLYFYLQQRVKGDNGYAYLPQLTGTLQE